MDVSIWARVVPRVSRTLVFAQPQTGLDPPTSVSEPEMSSALSDENEIKAYLEDVQIFIDLIKNDTDALHTTDLAFFREYLTSLGATIPPPSAGGGAKVEEVQDDEADTRKPATAPATTVEDEEEDESSDEEDEEADDGDDDEDLAEPDTEPFPEQPGDVAEPDHEAAGEKKMAANEKKAAGEFGAEARAGLGEASLALAL